MRWVQCDNIKFWQSIFTMSQHSHQICIWFAAGCTICRGTSVLVTRQQCLCFNICNQCNVLACDCNIYSAWTNFRSLLHQHEERSSYQCMSTNSFRSTDPQCVDLNPLDFYLWGQLKPLCIHLQLKMKRHSPAYYKCLQTIHHFPRTSESVQGVQDQTCSSAQWFMWRTFWAFAVYCDLITSKNSTVGNAYCKRAVSVVSKTLHI